MISFLLVMIGCSYTCDRACPGLPSESRTSPNNPSGKLKKRPEKTGYIARYSGNIGMCIYIYMYMYITITIMIIIIVIICTWKKKAAQSLVFFVVQI